MHHHWPLLPNTEHLDLSFLKCTGFFLISDKGFASHLHFNLAAGSEMGLENRALPPLAFVSPQLGMPRDN